MKNNNLNGNQEFEELLKNKMDELSSSVECFDKISARAFPEKNADFFESELTVSGLENVTGKRRGLPVLKWVSAAAALVLFIGIIPKTAIVNNIMTNMNEKAEKKLYSEIIEEINEETASFDYTYYDVSLDYYITNDMLVHPLYSCPFEENKNKDAKVRIFVKQCGENLTNQLYAVEYSGAYEDENFIAAADSRAKFTQQELNDIRESTMPFYGRVSDCADTVEGNFNVNVMGNTVDKEGYAVSAASYSSLCYFKTDNNEIYPLTTSVLYYHRGIIEDNVYYYYDIKSNYLVSKFDDSPVINTLDISNSDSLWENSLYYDGTSAAPQNNQSAFSRVELFGNEKATNADNFSFYFINPGMTHTEKTLKMRLYSNYSHTLISNIDAPVSNTSKLNHVIYFPQKLMELSSYAPLTVEFKASGYETSKQFYADDLGFASKYSDEMTEQIQNNISLLENDIDKLKDEITKIDNSIISIHELPLNTSEKAVREESLEKLTEEKQNKEKLIEEKSRQIEEYENQMTLINLTGPKG